MLGKPLRIRGDEEVDDNDGLVLKLPFDRGDLRGLLAGLCLSKGEVQKALVFVLEDVPEWFAGFVAKHPLKKS